MNRRARLLTDEDVRGRIVAGLRRSHQEIDVIDVRDVGLDATPDPIILEWAARHGRIVVTQDEETMIAAAYERVGRLLPFPGMILAPLRCPAGRAIRDIAALVERSETEPLENRIVHLPLDNAWRVSETEVEWTAGAVR